MCNFNEIKEKLKNQKLNLSSAWAQNKKGMTRIFFNQQSKSTL